MGPLIIGPTSGASRPRGSNPWMILLPTPLGAMVARIAIFVPGSAVLSSSNDRPSSKYVTTTSCLPPDRVSIVPVAPSLSGPSRCDAFMSGFHSGKWLTSDQTCQTLAVDDAVNCEASLNALSPPTPRPLLFATHI